MFARTLNSLFRLKCIALLICFFAHFHIALAQTSTPFPEPIDIVYLWVDGSDPEWFAIKSHYQRALTPQSAPTQDAHTINRFCDNEELRYSLRSILKYAPFFNHIYIVTMNQIPKWLKPHPDITIVDHTEIFLNQHDLPTFNSQALECNLHRIPNLKEHFIYFNDDVLLGRRVSPFDFFTLDGKVKVLFESSLSPSGPPNDNETTYRTAWRNTNALLDMFYIQEPRYRLCHAPFALKKSYIEATEEEFPFIFSSNSSHKFRCKEDYNVTNGLFQYHWLYHDKVEKGDLSNLMVTLRADEWIIRTKRAIARLKSEHPHTFCLQDNMDEKSDVTKRMLRELLESWYPEPAPWEKEVY
ncbi:MAG: stealth family protein [Rhabdochlamydiaceae bacterium]|nr:stealth family protein [Rhabdochlamydiaceae bacterium]